MIKSIYANERLKECFELLLSSDYKNETTFGESECLKGCETVLNKEDNREEIKNNEETINKASNDQSNEESGIKVREEENGRPERIRCFKELQNECREARKEADSESEESLASSAKAFETRTEEKYSKLNYRPKKSHSDPSSPQQWCNARYFNPLVCEATFDRCGISKMQYEFLLEISRRKLMRNKNANNLYRYNSEKSVLRENSRLKTNQIEKKTEGKELYEGYSCNGIDTMVKAKKDSESTGETIALKSNEEYCGFPCINLYKKRKEGLVRKADVTNRCRTKSKNQFAMKSHSIDQILSRLGYSAKNSKKGVVSAKEILQTDVCKEVKMENHTFSASDSCLNVNNNNDVPDYFMSQASSYPQSFKYKTPRDSSIKYNARNPLYTSSNHMVMKLRKETPTGEATDKYSMVPPISYPSPYNNRYTQPMRDYAPQRSFENYQRYADPYYPNLYKSFNGSRSFDDDFLRYRSYNEPYRSTGMREPEPVFALPDPSADRSAEQYYHPNNSAHPYPSPYDYYEREHNGHRSSRPVDYMHPRSTYYSSHFNRDNRQPFSYSRY